MRSRNCYLVFGNVENEDCAYGHIVWKSKDCYDCLYCYRCERCYECVDCVECNSVGFSRDSNNCVDSLFWSIAAAAPTVSVASGSTRSSTTSSINRIPRKTTSGKLAELNTGSLKTVDLARDRVGQLIGAEVVKNYHGFGCENVTGDYLYNCKNVFDGYDLKNCEDCRHCTRSKATAIARTATSRRSPPNFRTTA